MKAVEIDPCNCVFRPPPQFDESQIHSITAYKFQIQGSLDGEQGIAVAWQPDAEDIRRISEGGRVYLTMVSGLLPHRLSTTWEDATK